MNRFLLLAFSVVAIAASSCKKDAATSENEGVPAGELTVPTTFDWGTSRDVTFSISVTDTRFDNKIHVIAIYAGDPASGGTLLSKGSATLTSSFNTRVYIPATVSEVFVMKTAPDGSSVTNKVAITSTDVSLAVGATAIVKSMRAISAVGFQTSAVPETSPDCASGSGVTQITASTSGFSAQSGRVYSVTASNVTVGLGWSHNGTLYICGKNVTLTGGNMNGLNLIITNSGSVTINGVQWNAQASLKNFGSLTIVADQWSTQAVGTFYNAGTVTADYLTLKNGTATNFGTITANKEIWVDVQSVFTNQGVVNALGNFRSHNGGHAINNGTINVTGKFQVGASPSKFDNYKVFTTASTEVIMNAGGTVTNAGTFTAENAQLDFAGSFTNDGQMRVKSLTAQSGTFTNRCKLVVLTNFYLNGAVMNNQSFVDVKGSTGMNSNLNLSAKAMFRTNNLLSATQTVSGPAGGDSWALFRVDGVSNSAVNTAGGIFTGQVLYCDSKRTLDARHFSNSAKNGCDIYIAADDCSEGYGVNPNPTLPDTDKDGVIDSQDDYPSDPTRAFKHLQYNYANGGSTIAFEDKWPQQGDYDMNDIVINYRYEVATNAANQVVSVNANYSLLATGGEYTNGAGIQFNIPRANLVSISGAEAEAGQDSLVVILFKNSREEQTNWNTSQSTAAASKAYSIAFTIKNGPTIDKFGVGNYNLFIWNNTGGFGRGYETHLPGRQPTKLANRTLFGTGDDNTTSSRPYYSKSGLVWALEVPVSNFKYPTEKTDITKAYLRFADWAKSGGQSSADWYTNSGPAYRDNASIFSK